MRPQKLISSSTLVSSVKTYCITVRLLASLSPSPDVGLGRERGRQRLVAKALHGVPRALSLGRAAPLRRPAPPVVRRRRGKGGGARGQTAV